MDGWCAGILNGEFFEIYGALKENRSVNLKPVQPYRVYINWLDTLDRDASARYLAEISRRLRRPGNDSTAPGSGVAPGFRVPAKKNIKMKWHSLLRGT